MLCTTCFTDEMEGPGYSRIEGVHLASIKSTIIKHQADFLRQEHLPIPPVRKESDEDPPATRLLTILSHYVVVLTYMIRIFNLGGGNQS